MNKNSFEFATKKQYDLAESVKERIINDIKYMNNLNELNQVANTNFEKKELIKFYNEKDDLYDMDMRKVEFRYKMALTEKTDEMIG